MLKNLEYYKPDVDKTFAVMTKLFDDAHARKGGNVTFQAYPPLEGVAPSLDLTTYDWDTDVERYADDLCAIKAAEWEARRDIDDCSFPLMTEYLGIGDFSAFVAGDISFSPDTSWSKPSLKELRDYKALPQLGSTYWYGKVLEIIEALLQRVAPTGIPYMRGYFAPLDLANALRGDQIYMDFYDDPDGVHELLDYCATATIRYAEDVAALAHKYLGHTEYGMWYLEGSIAMSEDIACMCSPKVYRGFALPHTQRVIDHFGRGYMHTHSRAMYLVKEICDLKSATSLWLATDPNQPRPIDMVEDLVRDGKGVCLSIDCERFEEIEENFEEMQKGNFTVALPVKDMEEGIRLTERFQRLG